MSKTVLCYGHEAMLVHTRMHLLQLVGCLCDSAIDEDQYKTRLLNSLPKVIVLCHSLSPQECATACSFAAQHAPDSRVLLLYTRAPKCFPPEQHTVLDTSVGPRIFSQTVLDLLDRSADVPPL